MSVLEPIHSPQQDFAKFGQWLGPRPARNHPMLGEILEVADFIVHHDPAVLTCLSGQRPDYSGRDVRQIEEN